MRGYTLALAALAATAFAEPTPYTAPAAPDVKAWPREKLITFMHELADFVYE